MIQYRTLKPWLHRTSVKKHIESRIDLPLARRLATDFDLIWTPSECAVVVAWLQLACSPSTFPRTGLSHLKAVPWRTCTRPLHAAVISRRRPHITTGSPRQPTGHVIVCGAHAHAGTRTHAYTHTRTHRYATRTRTRAGTHAKRTTYKLSSSNNVVRFNYHALRSYPVPVQRIVT